MAFGLAEFNFGRAFKYRKEDYGEHINIIFAYILILLIVLLVLLGLLNLLLSSIIRDHKEMQAEVALNNILFMAQYTVWADFYITYWFSRLPCSNRILRWIGSHVGIKENKTVRYCTLTFCASAVKDRAHVCKNSCYRLQKE